jgi:hypothetical protein
LACAARREAKPMIAIDGTHRAWRRIMKFQQALLACLLGLAVPQALACYTVYDRNGRVVYNGEAPPVDMSRPLHETLPDRFPGGHMVFDAQAWCDSITPMSPVVAGRGGTPLLTDRRTAQAMNVPYTMLPGGIALVQAHNAAPVRPGVTVVPAEALAASAPASGTVITELRNPPMTIVQSGDRVVMSELSR